MDDRLFFTFDESGEIKAFNFIDYLNYKREYPKWNNQLAENYVNGCRISTVLLSVEHGRDKHNDVIIFETMIFTKRCGIWRGVDQRQCYRTTNIEQAKQVHKVVCELVKRKRITEIKKVSFVRLLSFPENIFY